MDDFAVDICSVFLSDFIETGTGLFQSGQRAAGAAINAISSTQLANRAYNYAGQVVKRSKKALEDIDTGIGELTDAFARWLRGENPRQPQLAGAGSGTIPSTRRTQPSDENYGTNIVFASAKADGNLDRPPPNFWLSSKDEFGKSQGDVPLEVTLEPGMAVATAKYDSNGNLTQVTLYNSDGRATHHIERPDQDSPYWHFHDFTSDPGNPQVGHGRGQAHTPVGGRDENGNPLGSFEDMRQFMSDIGFDQVDWEIFNK